MKRKGICVAGTMLVDMLYPVKGLPGPGELTTISDPILKATGGAVCNVIGDLAVIDPALPLTALGRVGTDSEGDFILESLKDRANIDCSLIKREGRTSFTAVMADEISKERTFFHYRGANAAFCEDDIPWGKTGGLFHIGYILLLDSLDEEDTEYGTKMARLLFHAKEQGLETSVDVVSETGSRYTRLVPPALKYTDYCVINEMEAEQVTGVRLRDGGGALLRQNLPEALAALRRFGVIEWAVIHSPEGGFGLDRKGNYRESKSVNLPPDAIKGKVGAGDAFCAGTLYAAAGGMNLEEGLELGNAAAAASLMMPGATEGMKSAEELKKLAARFGT